MADKLIMEQLAASIEAGDIFHKVEEKYFFVLPFVGRMIRTLLAQSEENARLRAALENIAGQYVPSQSADTDLAECHRIALAAIQQGGDNSPASPKSPDRKHGEVQS